MSATPMYPLTAEEREAVRRLTNPDVLDLAFLSAIAEAPRGSATREYLQARAAGLPKVAAAVPRWLASARKRRLIERRVNPSATTWALTPLGDKRLTDLQRRKGVPRIRLSKVLS